MIRLPRFSLPRSVGILLGILVGVFLVERLGRFAGGVSAYRFLWLSSDGIWGGEVWRLATYGVLPGGFFDLVLCGIGVVWFGSRVARVWSGREFFGYCGICVVAGGIGRVLVAGSGETILGSTAIVIGLLVPWARMFGHERIRLFGVWEARIFSVAVVLGLAMAALPLVSGGWKQSVLLFGAAGGGWFYLSVRWRKNQEIPAAAVGSERIGRLEL